MAEAAADADIRIEPAWKVSIVYGMPCPFITNSLLPIILLLVPE